MAYSEMIRYVFVLSIVLIDVAQARQASPPPFSRTFRNIDSVVFDQYFYYYLDQGFKPRTISSHLNNGTVLVSGSFQSGIDGPARFTYFSPEAEFLAALNREDSLGMRPREVSATIGKDGKPRFNAIWQKRGTELSETHVGWTDAEYEDQFSHLFSQGYRVEDHFTYSDQGIRKHVVSFVRDQTTEFYAIYGYLPENFLNFSRRISVMGYRPTSLYMEERENGNLMGAVFAKKAGTWNAQSNLTVDEYDLQERDLTEKGFQLWKIQGYDNSTHFSAIWQK